jgi:hypothetical protein
MRLDRLVGQRLPLGLVRFNAASNVVVGDFEDRSQLTEEVGPDISITLELDDFVCPLRHIFVAEFSGEIAE